MEYRVLSDNELLAKLDEFYLADCVERSEEWRIFREALERVKKIAIKKLVDTPTMETEKIRYWQVFYSIADDFFGNVVRAIKAEGQMVFEEAKDRGIIK